MIPILFLCYNRLEYTKKSLEALMATNYPIEVYIHDNGSTDGTVEYLKIVGDREQANNLNWPIAKIVYSEKNIGLNKPFNNFLRIYKDSSFVAKVDNDTIMPPNWLNELFYVMTTKPELDAVSAYLQRPPGSSGTFEEWKNSSFMRKVVFDDKTELAYCSYCAGSGVLIRMRMFKEMGLLWEGYKSVQGDLTCMFRLRSNHGKLNNIAWYSGITGKLLNIKVDGKELSDDYPEYDKEIQSYRDAGNKWFTEQGGADGIAKLIEQSGGREKL